MKRAGRGRGLGDCEDGGDHALGYCVWLDVEAHEDELPQRGEGYMDILLALLELRVMDEGDDEVRPSELECSTLAEPDAPKAAEVGTSVAEDHSTVKTP